MEMIVAHLAQYPKLYSVRLSKISSSIKKRHSNYGPPDNVTLHGNILPYLYGRFCPTSSKLEIEKKKLQLNWPVKRKIFLNWCLGLYRYTSMQHAEIFPLCQLINNQGKSIYSDWLRAGHQRDLSSIPSRVKNFLLSTSSWSFLGAHPASYPMGNGGKAVGAWSWSLTSNYCRDQENTELYIHFPIRLHGVMLN
jgi:hypothetical protein